MPSREMIADQIDLMITAHAFDAMVLLSNCDKVTPGMLMAAARLEHSGHSHHRWPHGQRRVPGPAGLLLGSDRSRGLWSSADKMPAQDLTDLEQIANIGPGACALMGTANCMNMLTEALGMTMTDGALTPATYGKRRTALARQAGHHDHAPAQQQYPAAGHHERARHFENAIAVDMAVGGSTNTCLHLPAVARELGIELTMDIFAEVAARTPHLTLLKPAGKYFPRDMYDAGGVAALMNELVQTRHDPQGLHHRDRPAPSARTSRAVEIIDTNEIIHRKESTHWPARWDLRS